MDPSASPINPATQPKVGRIRRGWELTKSSWHVLKLDKELATLPLLGFIWSIVAIVGYFAVVALLGIAFVANTQSGAFTFEQIPAWFGVIAGFGIYFIGTVIMNFFGAAIVYGAAERFNGGDPTVKSSIAGARRKFRPLLGFSMMMATVGMIFQILEERLPFAGQIAAYIFDAAWTIANIFAIPVIVLSEESVQPLEATKKSVGIIKKVWGESVVANVGIGIISGLSILAYGIVSAAATIGVAGLGGAYFILPFVLAILGFVALILLFSTLSSIATTALYIYATTGKAPGSFKRELLESSMTQKKARKIFA